MCDISSLRVNVEMTYHILFMTQGTSLIEQPWYKGLCLNMLWAELYMLCAACPPAAHLPLANETNGTHRQFSCRWDLIQRLKG